MVRPLKWGLGFLSAIFHYPFKFSLLSSTINDLHSSNNNKNKNNLNVNIKHAESYAKNK